MMVSFFHARQPTRWVYWLVLLCWLGGCASITTPPYDRATEEALVQFQRELEDMLITLEKAVGTPAADHAVFVPRYQTLEVALSSLTVRQRARVNNEIMVEQLELFADSLANFEEVHRLGIQDPAVVGVARSLFNSSLTGILRLELQKKPDTANAS